MDEGTKFYKQSIVEMVDGIKSKELLITIFVFIKTWLEN